jgi:CCR4-NOT transcription complex subunit 1
MTQNAPGETTYGRVPTRANVLVIGAIVIYAGKHGAERAAASGGAAVTVTGEETDVAVLSLLVHELSPEARYYLLASMVNQLRFPNTQTDFYSQVILYMFGKDLDDPEETDIRQEMTRILLERLVGYWPQPWGLVYTVAELVKNEKYMFFELPFIKATPEVRQ